MVAIGAAFVCCTIRPTVMDPAMAVENDEGQPDVAEEADVGHFVLGGGGVHDGLSGPALSDDQMITAPCLYGT